MRVTNGELSGLVIKDVNERLNCATTPCCRLDAVEVAGESLCDLFATSMDSSWHVRTANLRELVPAMPSSVYAGVARKMRDL